MIRKLMTVMLVTIIFIPTITGNVYANEIYNPFPKDQKEDSSDVIKFKDLNLKEALLEYYKFNIDKDYEGRDITISMMREFTSLKLSWANIFSLDGMEYAINLKNLDLANNFIENITPISTLSRLETLNLANNKILNAEDLGRLDKLKKLSLKKNLITNIDFLSRLSLEELDISYNSNLKTYVEESLDLTKLKKINITALGIENLNFLEHASKLEELDAENNEIKDISILANMTNLKKIYIDKNNVVDIQSLSQLENLREFTAANNNIKDLQALDNKQYLDRVILDGNASLSDVDIFKNANNLGSLSIASTAVSDISALKDLKYLFYIDVTGAKVTEEEQENFKIYNKQLKLKENIDKDIEVISSNAAKYFSIKNYIFMFLISVLTISGILSYWKRNK